MKRYLLIVLFLVAGVSFPSAQGLVVFDSENNNISNSPVTVAVNSSASYFKKVFILNNPGDDEIVVSMRKIEVEVVEGTDNSFCFAGKCYMPSVFVAPDNMVLAAGSTTTATDCYAEFYPNENTGNTTVRYEFFSDEKAFDTIYVEVTFVSSQPSSINISPFSDVYVSDPYPNPARDHTNIDYSFPPNIQKSQVVIRSLTGQVVNTFPINIAGNNIRIDTSSLNRGMYFYSIELNGQIFVSKRLIVNR